MENLRCRIIINNENSYAGKMISGAVLIKTNEECVIQHAFIEVFGISKCKFKLDKILIKLPRFYGKNTEFTGEEIFFFSRHTLAGGDGILHVVRGVQLYPFQCKLPQILPATWTGTYGNIRYSGRVIVKGGGNVAHIHVQEIIISPRKDLSINNYLMCEARQDVQRTFRFATVKLGTVDVSLWLPICGIAAGQSIPLLCTIENNSKIHFGGIIFVLTRKEIYRSHIPVKTAKVIRKDMCRIPRMADILKGKYEYFCVLQTNQDYEPTNQHWHSSPCHLVYEVWVSVHGAIPRFKGYGYPNIDTPGIPIIIGTEPLKTWNSEMITAALLNEVFSSHPPVVMEPPPPDDEVEELLLTVEEELDEQTVQNLTRQIDEQQESLFQTKSSEMDNSINED